MAMHMFVPALPYAASDLGANSSQMQLTITLYIVGLGVGQLFYGPLSDALGRRPMLIAGLALYAGAGLAAALATGVHVLLLARLVQALGGCAGLALGRAIVRDTTRADKAVRQLALMNLMTMVGPGLAPMVGGTISALLGWRAVFWLLATFGLVALVFTWRLLPETGGTSHRVSVGTLIQDYKSLLSSPKFVGFAFGGGATAASLYPFIVAAPFIFANQLHRPLEEVGFYLGFLIFGAAVGNLVTSRLVGRVSMERLLLSGSVLSIVSATVLLTTILLDSLNLSATLCLVFLFTCGIGAASPVGLAKAISVNPKLIGSAAGLYGFSQMALGAIFTWFAALGHNPARAAATVLTVAVVLGQISFWIGLKSGRRGPEKN
jgi:DHA1 family bicyclomycin/chloramphenicol resistance-like MFS transporter